MINYIIVKCKMYRPTVIFCLRTVVLAVPDQTVNRRQVDISTCISCIRMIIIILNIMSICYRQARRMYILRQATDVIYSDNYIYSNHFTIKNVK